MLTVSGAFKTAKAYRTAKGRKVFSGGGILPDIFVPADTAGNTQLVQELNEQQIFGAFVIDRMQPLLNTFASDDAFLKNYNVSDSQFDAFILYASKTLKEMDSAEVKASKENIKQILKTYAARYKWGDSAYFEVLNSDDTTLKKAIASIN